VDNWSNQTGFDQRLPCRQAHQWDRYGFFHTQRFGLDRQRRFLDRDVLREGADTENISSGITNQPT